MLPTPQLHHFPSQPQQILIIKDFNPSQLLKYSNLSKLKINLPINQPLGLFNKLCKDLKTLKSLKSLHLNCSGQGINDSNIKVLSFVLRRLYGLKSVTLNLKHNYGVNGESIVELFKGIKKKRSVEKIWIDFSGCGKISYEHLTSIYTSLSEMKPLKYFYINYSEVLIQCEGSKELLENSFRRLRKLRCLEGLLINDKMLQINMATLSHNISRMKKLSKFSLDFENFSILEPNDFDLLIHSLKSCCKLQKLHLNFLQFSSSNFATQNLFDLISKALENSPSLSNLLLNFSYNHRATSSQLQKLFLTLQTLPSLSTLDLNFSFCPNLDNKTLEFLSKSLMNLKNLTSLKINLFQCSLMNGQGLITFSEALRNLTSLQVFEFSFTSHAIQSGFPSFSQALIHLKNLSRLSLRFCDSQNFSDEDLKILAETLSCLKSLKSLDLSFSFCVLITDIGLKNLALSIKNLQCLNILSLNCFGCRRITKERVEYFKYHISRLKSLREISWEFPKNLGSVSFCSHQPQQEFSCQSTCSIF